MNYRRLAMTMLVAVVVWTTPTEGESRHDGTYLHVLTDQLVTPHLSWGKPLAGGPVKSLFIVPRRIAAREVVELAQRLDLDYQAVATGHAGALGLENAYDGAVEGTSTYEKTQELLEKLEQRYEVIVLANFNFHALPAEAQYKLLRQVTEGAGLVIVYSRPIRYSKLFQHKTEDWRSILALTPPQGLPRPLQGVSDEKLLQTYRVGKGRIAVLAYPGPAPGAVNGGLGLTVDEEYSPQWRGRYECNMALVGRSLLWAAGRAAALSMRLDAVNNLSAEELGTRGLRVAFDVPAPAGTTVRLRLRDAWNRVCWEGIEQVANGGKPAQTGVKLPPLAAGTYTLDARAERDGKVIDFGYQCFTVASRVGELRVTTDKASYERGEVIRGKLALEIPSPVELTLHVRLEDLPYRQVWAKSRVVMPAGQRETAFELPAGAAPTIAGAVVCEVADSSGPVGRAERTVFVPERKIELFPTLLWGSVPEQLSEMYAQVVVEGLGWRAGLSQPSSNAARVAALFDQRFVPYMTRIGLKADKDGRTQTAYWLGLDKKDVAAAGVDQDGSFYKPAVQALWKKSIEKRIEGLPAVGPMLYALGDENHFSYDAGYSPSDEKAFRQYLRQRYGRIERLNAEWKGNYADFDVVPHESSAALHAQGKFAAWYDHRRFMEKQYAQVHHYLADCIRAIDPHAKVGAEGSVPGDLELTISKLDFWGPYSDPVMDELLRSIGGDKLRMLWWGGYVGSHGGRDVYPYPLWRPLLQGVVNGSAWYASGVSSMSFLGADYSYAEYFRQMRPRLQVLENGAAQLLISQSMKADGIAILWSHASQAASLMDERFFKPTDSINALMQFCYRQGLNFDFLTSSMVEQGKLEGYRVLWLCGASALSQKEIQEITAFARRGGVVVADLKPGVLNDYCRPLERSGLAELLDAPALTWQSKPVLKPVKVQQSIRGRSLRFDAERAWQSPEVPAFTARTVGEGTVVLLNFNLGSAVNTASSQTPFDAFVLELLALGRVGPSVRVNGLSTEQLLVRVRQGGGCTTVGVLAARKDVGKTMDLVLDRPAYVYEVGKGELGRHQRITSSIDEPFRLWCVFEEQPTAPVLRLDRLQLNVGQAARLDVSALPAGGVYRLELIDPQGKVVERRGRVLTDRDRTEPVELRFAYSDAPGAYRAVLTDVRTALRSEAKIQVDGEKP